MRARTAPWMRSTLAQRLPSRSYVACTEETARTHGEHQHEQQVRHDRRGSRELDRCELVEGRGARDTYTQRAHQIEQRIVDRHGERLQDSDQQRRDERTGERPEST